MRINEQQMMLENQRTTVEAVSALSNAAKASKQTMHEMKVCLSQHTSAVIAPRLPFSDGPPKSVVVILGGDGPLYVQIRFHIVPPVEVNRG